MYFLQYQRRTSLLLGSEQKWTTKQIYGTFIRIICHIYCTRNNTNNISNEKKWLYFVKLLNFIHFIWFCSPFLWGLLKLAQFNYTAQGTNRMTLPSSGDDVKVQVWSFWNIDSSLETQTFHTDFRRHFHVHEII